MSLYCSPLAPAVLLWRESASGLSLPAYFFACNVIDWLWVLLAPAISLGPYYYLTLPRMAFGQLYAAGLGVCWWCSGMAYLVSAVLPPQSVLMAGVFIALICGAFLHGLSPTLAAARGTALEGVLGLSYNRWAMEAVTLAEFRYYEPDMRTTLMSLSRSIGLCGVDKLLRIEGGKGDGGGPGGGGEEVTALEALRFLGVQRTFTVAGCDRYSTAAYVALAGLGLGFRLLGFLLLRRSCLRRQR
ncbi:hypothetical protein GPECTOR_17g939 [Gonium pectorale]|uniref:ABC transporter family G domain-containing protein n=1 Tax=Gonium pectorale TaxID=33097 RepID=A0A150GLV5_GONPE|nr:hypothetical protein GPECTOR_17g939 [Gonium pectorale]|eukprot:KXZ50300.1 hypothetical protein GPECTOR_17g939 [Gonium pectorale]